MSGEYNVMYLRKALREGHARRLPTPIQLRRNLTEQQVGWLMLPFGKFQMLMQLSCEICSEMKMPVASLGWVTPGAATERVTPLFFLKTRRPFLLIAVTITIAFYCFYSGVTPPLGCHPHLFTCPTSFLHYSL